MDDGAAGLLKGTVSFRASPSETPAKFDPNIRLKEKWIGKRDRDNNGNRAASSTTIGRQDLVPSICRIIIVI